VSLKRGKADNGGREIGAALKDEEGGKESQVDKARKGKVVNVRKWVRRRKSAGGERGSGSGRGVAG